MREQRGLYVSLVVVAAKVPGKCIIRAWKPFARVDELRREVERYVGRLDPTIEWTYYTYELPAYLVYGSRFDGGDLDGWDWPMGVYEFPYTGDSSYRGPIKCLATGHGALGELFGMVDA